jgi:DNA invertase Pin-like site-specific DNA recombinase
LLDFAGLMDRATREHWALVSLDIGVDTSTMSGRAVASVMATFSQLEREMIGARTRDALAARRAAGVRLGRPPVMDGAVVDRMRAMRDEGATYQEIADALEASQTPTSRGGARWYPSTVRAALKRS